MIFSSLKSTCLLDFVSSHFLPHCIDSIAPIITYKVNLSLSIGVIFKLPSLSVLQSCFILPYFAMRMQLG